MAADAQDKLPIFDYHVISEGGPKNRKPGEKPKPPDKWEEPVWKEEPPDGKWGHGPNEIGKVEIHAKGSEEDPDFDADFTFTDPPCRIKVDGKVPGGKNWQGKAKAKAKGQDGACKGREAEIEIEFKNPKRW